MIMECWVIIVLFLVMTFMVFRTGRTGQAVAILPLLLVPLAHILGSPISRFLDDLFPGLSGNLFWISSDVVGLVATCVLCGLLAGNMGTRRGRRMYMLLCGSYSAALTIVLVNAVLPL